MAEEIFRILQERSVGIVEFRVRPDSDAMALDVLMETISIEFDNRKLTAWVLDLTQVRFLNSAGLGMLVNIRQKIRQSHGKLALCGLSNELMELFRSCCLERLFIIEKTRPAAVAAVS
jgi:anti-sigma B factor antagonist